MAASAETTVAALTAVLREEILDGELRPGTRLVEREIVERHGVARVSARSALARLAAEGLVTIEPHRGARVASLDPDELHDLFALRAALECEAVRIALAERPEELDARLAAANEALARACGARRVVWRRVVDAHEGFHRELVAAAHSPRIAAAHAALAGELRLFVVALRPVWSAQEMIDHHEQLRRVLPLEGPEALRRHLDDGEKAVLVPRAAGAA